MSVRNQAAPRSRTLPTGRLLVLLCASAAATARSFISYCGTAPTLVLVVGSDEVVGLADTVTPLADGVRVPMKVIEGADHTFRDLYAEEAVDAFLKTG